VHVFIYIIYTYNIAHMINISYITRERLNVIGVYFTNIRLFISRRAPLSRLQGGTGMHAYMYIIYI